VKLNLLKENFREGSFYGKQKSSRKENNNALGHVSYSYKSRLVRRKWLLIDRDL